MKEPKFKVGDRVKILDKEGSRADKFRPFVVIEKIVIPEHGVFGPAYHFINPRNSLQDYFDNEDIFEKDNPMTWKEKLQ